MSLLKKQKTEQNKTPEISQKKKEAPTVSEQSSESLIYMPSDVVDKFFAKRLPVAQPIPKTKKRSFNFVSFLQYREPIAGVAIHEESVAFMLYRMVGRDNLTIIAEEKQEISPGTITQGTIRDPEALVSGLLALFQKARTKNPSVVLSLPPEAAWITTLEFPGHLTRNSLEEAVNLHLEFSLPFPKEEAYVDWEHIGDRNTHNVARVLVGAALKTYVDPYVESLTNTGATAIAVETHLMSIERALRGRVSGALAYLLIYPSGAHIGVYNDSLFRFQRFVPWTSPSGIEEVKKSDKNLHSRLVKELKNMRSFLATEPHDALDIRHIMVLGSQEFTSSFLPFAQSAMPEITILDAKKFAPSVSLLIAQGAAYRGILPRREDTLLSFAAIGTETIYERTRAASFSDFFKKLSVGIVLFFALLYMGSYLLLLNISHRVDTQQTFEAPVAQDLAAIQESAKRFNEEVKTLALLAKRNPQWADGVEEAAILANPGVVIQKIAIDDIAKGIAISGVAKNRDALLQLKATIASSRIFKPVDIPFSLFIGKGEIPFSFKLTLKNNQQFSSP